MLAAATHIIIEQHKPLFGPLVRVSQGVLLERWRMVSLVFATDVLQEKLHDGPCPRMTGMALDASEQLFVPLVLLLIRHDETFVDGIADAEQIVRVDL